VFFVEKLCKKLSQIYMNVVLLLYATGNLFYGIKFVHITDIKQHLNYKLRKEKLDLSADMC